MPQPLAMRPEEFELFNELLTSQFGLHFPEHKKAALEYHLKPRLEALRLRGYMDYYLLLQCDLDSERDHLARAVTNNETYFFRETGQLDAFFGEGVAALKESPAVPGSLRILCAGCSSGEEPYTIGIYARENQFRAWGTAFRIDAFDLDREAVRVARSGEYGPNSFRNTSGEQMERYFLPATAEIRPLRPAYREGISFFWGNILEVHSFYRLVPYDALFCRNVLIYFSEATLHRAVDNFAHCLRPGGLLLLGHSETIIGVSDAFEPYRMGEYIVYRRT